MRVGPRRAGEGLRWLVCQLDVWLVGGLAAATKRGLLLCRQCGGGGFPVCGFAQFSVDRQHAVWHANTAAWGLSPLLIQGVGEWGCVFP